MSERIVIFDGYCNLCESSVRFIARRDRRGRFHFCPAQSATGQRLLREQGLNRAALDTFVLLKDGRAYTRSSAAVEIAKELDGLWKGLWLLIVIPRPLRNWAYALVARHRYRWFGRRQTCMAPDDALRARFVDLRED